MRKSDRIKVFEKFGGKCAYCGCELTKGWHVDEIEPVRREYRYKKDIDGNRIWNGKGYQKEFTMAHPGRLYIDNQYPACASCNINKHSMSLEHFRQLIGGFMKHLNEINTQYKLAKRYGLVQETGKEVKFYFETFSH